MSHQLLLVLHLLAASVWVGGHLILTLVHLPKALKSGDQQAVLDFEKQFGPVGLPALLVLVITGVWMSLQYGITMQDWFVFNTGIERVVSVKLLLLVGTVFLALSAQIRVLPKLKNNTEKLLEMAAHILLVTLIGVGMLLLGSLVRFGGL